MMSSLQSPQDALSLYVHVPFCARRCGYCHFNTYEGLERLFVPFADAVCRESAHYAAEIGDAWEVRTLFFGGGTPTYLPQAEFVRILRTLREQWHWQDGAEVTTEANPTHVTGAYLESLLEAGVNRLSYGAQAFDAGLLAMLDREHSVAQIGAAVQVARHAGFTNINLDLMYGLPTQTLAQWRQSLDAALVLQVEHLSLYGLTIDEGTAFKKRVEKGLLPEPDQDLAADMYELAEERLAEAGYRQYEISNWALPCRECHFIDADDLSAEQVMSCRHNLTYWLNEPYLGFGPGAHSFFGERRFWDINPVPVYVDKLSRGESVIGGSETISPALERAETVMLALRLNDGMERSRYMGRFGAPLDEQFGAVLRECAGWGLLTDDGECVRLTPRGRLLSNEVFQRLLPD
ncbi:MAG: radical SAM family heme chaperone HemW [Chloroflexi bacterium]|nr:radical SAM family heme chaperone HemW [Chloroflexota bacterium]